MNDEPEVPFEALEPAWEAIGSRVCPEPVPIGALIARAVDSVWLHGLPEPDPSKHPYQGICRQCGQELDIKWAQIAKCTGWFPVNIHVECLPAYCATIGPAGEQAEQWKRICPPDFRTPWDGQKGNGKLLSRVLQFDPKTCKGLLIHGPSGRGNTRVAWLLARQLMEGGFSVTFVASIDLPDEPTKEMMHASILIIDDFGNDRMQAKSEAIVLKILRNRTEWHRPTIVTTQFTGAQLEERFSDGHTARAVIRRLREYCDGVPA